MDRRPLWLWPNLLSLDAPVVAVVWLWMFAKSWRVVSFPWTIYLLVAGAVWTIYVVDRLLDTRVPEGMERSTRHAFHARHRKFLWGAVVVVTAGCLVLLATLPTGLWKHGAFVLLLVVGYFVLAFLHDGSGVSHVKNMIAGLAFAYGTSVGVHFYRPDSNLFYFLIAPEALTFGVLCILNITANNLWAVSRRTNDAGTQDTKDLLLSLLPLVLAGFCYFLAARADKFSKPFFLAVMASSGLLYVVDRLGHHISADLQRVLGDVVMVLSLPLFLAYYMFYSIGG